MTVVVNVSPDARRSLAQAVAWYSVNAPEQVSRLLKEFRATRKLLAEHPLIGREDGQGLRYRPLSVFPYKVWYMLENEGVVIVLLTHMRQDTMRLN